MHCLFEHLWIWLCCWRISLLSCELWLRCLSGKFGLRMRSWSGWRNLSSLTSLRETLFQNTTSVHLFKDYKITSSVVFLLERPPFPSFLILFAFVQSLGLHWNAGAKKTFGVKRFHLVSGGVCTSAWEHQTWQSRAGEVHSGHRTNWRTWRHGTDRRDRRKEVKICSGTKKQGWVGAVSKSRGEGKRVNR